MADQREVEVSYDVSNDFFELWLDEKMNYTCALFEDTQNFSDNLEAAQNNKLKRMSRLAGVGPHTETLLDIGCGWGANAEYQATVNGVKNIHAFTLSREQAKYCSERNVPNTTFTCDDYRKYEAPFKFDAAMTIGMMEHIVTPEEARAGRAIEIYRECFKRVHSWTKPGTFFSVQTITRCKTPRGRKELDDLRHINEVIFPGAVTPRVEDLIIACNPYYEVMELYSMRFHYRKTCELWRSRLRDHERVVREKWGDQVFIDYDRYLTTCMTAFENNWQSLHQYGFRRLDV